MHGYGIHALSGVDLLGKPVFMFDKSIQIPRGTAGTVNSGFVNLRLGAVFPVFENLNDETSNPDFKLAVTDFLHECSVIYEIRSYGGIDSGCLSIENGLQESNINFFDYVLQKNFSQSIMGDEFAFAPRLFNVHHTACDSSTAPSAINNFTIIIHGVGLYTSGTLKYL